MLPLFISQESKNLRDVALRASAYAKKEDHKEAARLRRLTRQAIEKSDPVLERRVNRVFAVACFIGVCAVLAMVKAGWLD